MFFANEPDPAEWAEEREELGLSLARYRKRLSVLSLRERRVVRARLGGAEFAAIGDKIGGVTRERARQIWIKAIKLLRVG